MTHRARIDPRVNTDSSVSGTADASLPDDLVEESARRLRIAAGTWMGLWTIGLVMNHIFRPVLDLPG